jgi:hypothetical protein
MPPANCWSLIRCRSPNSRTKTSASFPTAIKQSKLYSRPCESGGIGRRTRLRIWRVKPWGFESPLSHQYSTADLESVPSYSLSCVVVFSSLLPPVLFPVVCRFAELLMGKPTPEPLSAGTLQSPFRTIFPRPKRKFVDRLNPVMDPELQFRPQQAQIRYRGFPDLGIAKPFACAIAKAVAVPADGSGITSHGNRFPFVPSKLW